MKTRIMALLLCVIMAVSLFACDTNEDNTESETYAPTEEATTESETETETETETESESESETESESESESAAEYVCEHTYEFNCSDICTLCGEALKPGEHTFNSSSTCEDLVCECGYTIEQEHAWSFDDKSSTASLLTAGTTVYACSKCEKTETRSTDTVIDPLILDMPIVYISDMDENAIPLVDLEKADGEIVVKYKYVSNSEKIADFECFSKIKIQGSSSAKYPKKNFTIKLYKDETLESKNKVDLGWGKENKYCMKANYIDITQARNIVAAQLFAQVIESRTNINEGLKKAPNYGLIDGYPVLVYVNGSYHGIYTMNIPKDSWQFAMDGDESAKEALLMADGWSDYTKLKTPIGDVTSIDDFEQYKFEVEYASDENDVVWIRDSFNELITLLNCGDKTKIRAELADHLDIEAAIDNMIFTYYINAADNVAKNILWATYDGKVWIPSMYDMDGTFGNYWNGQPVDTKQSDGYPENSSSISPSASGGNKMWNILITCFPNEVEARYKLLRQEILTLQNAGVLFNEFKAKIHPLAFSSDVERWDTVENDNKIPYIYADTTRTNMSTSIYKQLNKMDEFFLNLVRKYG